MTQPDPWQTLRDQPHLDLVWGGLPAGWRGATDGHTIWIATGLTQRERRSALAHELAHIRLGLIGPQSTSCEERVREATARWLLPDLAVVADAMADSTPEAAALDLWVADDVLATRLAHLTDGERAYIDSRIDAA